MHLDALVVSILGPAFLAGLLFGLRRNETWPEALRRAGLWLTLGLYLVPRSR